MNDKLHDMLKRDLPSATREEMEGDVARVLNRLRSQVDVAGHQPIDVRVAAVEGWRSRRDERNVRSRSRAQRRKHAFA